VLPRDQLRVLPSGDPPFESGLYFLWCGPVLIYIGISKYLSDRLRGHAACRDGLRRGKQMPFTRHTYMELQVFDDGFLNQRKLLALQDLEAVYIHAYLPPFNDKIPPCY
jgi:hypothetical protein